MKTYCLYIGHKRIAYIKSQSRERPDLFQCSRRPGNVRGTWVSEVPGSLLCLAYVGNCRSEEHLLRRSPGHFRQLGHAVKVGASPVDWAEHSRGSTGRVKQRLLLQDREVLTSWTSHKVLQGHKDIIENEHFPIWKLSLQGKSNPRGLVREWAWNGRRAG